MPERVISPTGFSSGSSGRGGRELLLAGHVLFDVPGIHWKAVVGICQPALEALRANPAANRTGLIPRDRLEGQYAGWADFGYEAP